MNRIILFLKIVILFLFGFELSRLYFLLYLKEQLDERFINVWAMSSLSGLALDLSTVMYCVMPLFLLVFIEGIIRKPFPKWFYLFFLSIDLFCIFAISISDPELFRQWGNKFNNQVLVYINHPKEMAVSTGSVLWGKTILFALIFGTMILLLGKLIYRQIIRVRQYSVTYSITEVFLLALSFIVLRGGIGVATISQSSAIYSGKHIQNAASINSLWNALYYVFNDVESLYDGKFKVTESEKAQMLFKLQVTEGDTAELDLSDLKNPNILIVTLESFTASGSMMLEGVNDCMPNLDRISKENLCFTNCFSSGDRTEKGLISILSGYPAQPLSSIIVFPDKMSKLPSLGRSLISKGYTGYFYYGGDAEFASMKAYLVVNGIDNIVDKNSLDKSVLKSKWGAHDEDLYHKFLSDAKDLKQPFLANVLSLSSHEPYDVPFASADLKKDEWYPYKNSIRYADSCLADFLEKCKKQSWYANTLIVLVADHGHEIGLKDRYFFGKEKFHIPLVICGGALKQELKGVVLPQIVSQTIIPSLILGSMGLPVDAFKWQSGVFSRKPFAQYFYNNGFGRVEDKGWYDRDNLSGKYDFSGKAEDSSLMIYEGRIFQQILVEDFMKK